MTRQYLPRVIVIRKPRVPQNQGRNCCDPPGNQVKRRPHSGQEVRDGARLDPSKREDPHPAYRSSDQSERFLDIVALVCVLSTGIILLTVAHLSVDSLASVCSALVTLYTAWRHHTPTGSSRHRRR
jgi:hypothetical protein